MRYGIVPGDSTVTIDARSSVHPINTRTNGLTGFVELAIEDGAVDVDAPAAGELVLAVERLRSGNPLEDRELRRRIEARRFPTISGRLIGLASGSGPGRYRVTGDLTFRGVTRTCTDEMTVTVLDGGTIRLAGESRFDVRDFGMEPPRILVLRVEPEVRVRVELLARPEPAP
ncbi:MAG TPA: YceI family protein [Acidimicrobiia bacterium]|nr:YceI family protein [Acidimicrobiia bacterium]